ncbi:FtsK/SpoIIIE domain-containing protein [Tsukamurella pseudospumae]|uniref:FtsK/SpoIIIE domain-containing protein n=1 Tax=Tsukamurella pseudospumae TaxID=239498 RepID=UPI0018D318D4|nr:FtsK/SpoIIIE domain-containing protein [Tsukamurella pseudospumae]
MRKAVPGLRQALRAPDLEVTSRGVWPVLHLNTRKLVRSYPAQNPLSADRMYLPRTEAERYACASEVRLFLGVTEDGEVIAPKLATRSHAAIYGMTNSGKSTLMSVIARSLAAQGCEVWLADGKGTPEFRQLYLDRVPGITHLSVATPATMHATVHKLLELYRFRRDLGDELVQRGVTDIRWTRVVLIWDEMGAFLNSALSDGADPVARKNAEYTVNWLAEVAAKSRAYGVHLLVAGQHVYSAALPSKLRENLSIRVVLGRASDVHIQRLFEEDVRDAAKAAREGIEPGMRGRGIVQADDGGVVQMQAFYNDAAASAALDRAMAGTPRLTRWGHLFPVEPDAAGGAGRMAAVGWLGRRRQARARRHRRGPRNRRARQTQHRDRRART